MALRNFYVKTSKVFKIELKFNGVTPDIKSDTVSIIFKKRKTDLDSLAVLNKDADVYTEGNLGIATFTLSIEDTAISPGSYFYEIKWTVFGAIAEVVNKQVRIMESDRVTVLERVYD